MLSLLATKPSLHWLGKQLFNREDPAAFFDPLLERINPMWVRQYVPARVQAVVDETADTKTFILKPAARWGGFVAGQHVTIDVDIDGVRRTRTFSLSGAPAQWKNEGTVSLTIKRLPGGLATNWMHDNLASGDVIGMGEAFGDFRLPEADEPVLYVAGGSGVTPILSQLEAMAQRGYQAPVTLLYFVRTQADIIGAEKLHALRLNWPALTLRIIATNEGESPEYLKDTHFDDVPGVNARRCYLCGPKGLMDLAGELLAKRGIEEDRIHSTFFSVPTATLDGDSLGGEIHFSRSDIKVTSEGDAVLLETAEAAQLSPQHGCRMGLCHQCSCRKTSGTVVNRLTGRASGPGEETIQLCISVPRGPVSVDL